MGKQNLPRNKTNKKSNNKKTQISKDKVIKLDAVEDSQIITLLSKLESKDNGDKVWGLSTVSLLANKDEAILVKLIKNGLLQKLVQLLTFDNLEVQFEALGTLRNIVGLQNGGVASQLFQNKLLIPINLWITKLSNILTKKLSNTVNTEDKDELLELESCFQNLDNLIVVMWSLAEVNQKLLQQVCQPTFLNFLLQLVKVSDQLPTSTTTVVCNCLLTLSDHNLDLFLEYYLGDNLENLLVLNQMLTYQSPNEADAKGWNKIKVLVLGVLVNFKANVTNELEQKLLKDSRILELAMFQPQFYNLSLQLVTNGLESIQQLELKIEEVIKISNQPAGNLSEGLETVEANFKPPKVESLESTLQDQHLVMEILTNLLNEDVDDDTQSQNNDDEVDGENDEEIWDGDEGVEEEGEENLKNLDQLVEPSHLPEQLQQTFNLTFEQLVPHLVQLTLPHPIDKLPITTDSSEEQNSSSFLKEVQASVAQLHIKASTALNALLLKWETSTTPKLLNTLFNQQLQTNLQTWFQSLLQSLPNFTQENDSENLKVQLALTFTLFRTFGLDQLNPNFQNHLIDLLISLLPSPETLGSEETTFDVRVVVETIGILSYVIRRPNIVELNYKVAQIFIQIVDCLQRIQPNQLQISSGNAMKVLEISLVALDSLFDTFNDKQLDYDVNFRNSNWVQNLQKVQQVLPSLVKKIDKRKFMAVRQLAEDTKINLKDFINYKLQEYRS